MGFFENKDKIIEELRSENVDLKYKLKYLQKDNEELLKKVEHLQSDSLVQSLQDKIQEQAEYINTYVRATLSTKKGARRHKMKEEMIRQAEDAKMKKEIQAELLELEEVEIDE